MLMPRQPPDVKQVSYTGPVLINGKCWALDGCLGNCPTQCACPMSVWVGVQVCLALGCNVTLVGPFYFHQCDAFTLSSLMFLFPSFLAFLGRYA